MPGVRSLRPHQRDARTDVLHALRDHDRTLLVSACGTGKTLTLQAVAQTHAPGGLIAAFFPSLHLVGQALREWQAQYAGNWRTPMVVCSDPSTARTSLDEIRTRPEDLAALGAWVTSDADALAILLRRQHERVGADLPPQVVFATYHSSGKIAEAQRQLVDEGIEVVFDIAVLDEAHRLVPGASLSAHVLSDDGVRARKRVFATATPRQFHIDAEGLRADDVDLLTESVYGPVAHDYGLRRAIQDGVLVDYQLHVAAISPEELPTFDQASRRDLRLHLAIKALQSAREQHGVRRSIAYLSDVARARRFAALGREAGLNVSVVTGAMSVSERERELAAVFGSPEGGVIANVRCLTEGIDLPDLDAVVFVDPRREKIDIVQAVGRAIRTAPGKTLGHVIIPVLSPYDGEWSDAPGWETLTTVLAQMAENDTRLRTVVSTLATASPSHDSAMGTIDVMGSAGADAAVVAEVDVDALLRSAALRTVRALDLDLAWSSRLEAVATFRLEHGRLPSRYLGSAHERQLYTWLATQRAAGVVLSERRRSLLDEKLPGWDLTQRSDRVWREHLDELVAFARERGRLPGPSSRDFSERRLALWLRKQRENASLAPGRRVMLDQALPGWEVRRAGAKAWWGNLDAAAEFFAQHGRIPRARSSDPEERRLAYWVKVQRQRLHDQPDKQALLDERLPGWNPARSSPADPPRKAMTFRVGESGTIRDFDSRHALADEHGA